MIKSVIKPFKNGVVRLFIATIMRLPLSSIVWLGSGLGRIMYVINNRSKRVTVTNLKICFPEKDQHSHNKSVKESLIEDTTLLLEAVWLWKNGQYAVEHLVDHVENEYLLTEAANKNQSTILVTPHFGSWEFAGIYTAHRCELKIVYAPAKMDYIEKLSCQGRMSTGATLQKAEAGHLRGLLSHVKNGGNLGILPDQVPADNAGVYTPFFKRQAYTSTLIHKLANKHDCKIIIGYAIRSKSRPWKYNIYYYPAPNEFYTQDPQISTRVLNEFIEECVRTSPSNYLWSYKRFKSPAPGDSSPY